MPNSDIYWLPEPHDWVGLTTLPGRRDGIWNCSIHVDAGRLRKETDVLVSLTGDDEFFGLTGYSAREFGEIGKELGLRVVHRPYPPGTVAMDHLGELLQVLEKVQNAGERVAIFCHDGPQRSGALAALLLMKDGAFPLDAIQTVRSVRPDAIMDAGAEKWLLDLEPDDFLSDPPDYDVVDALTTCAYRLDVRAYLDSLHVPPFPVPHQWFGTPRWGILDDISKMHSFFGLLRYLRHWGGQTLPETENEWHVARGMFLELCRIEIPAGVRLERYARRWEEDFVPRLDDVIRRVEREQARLPRTFRGYAAS